MVPVQEGLSLLLEGEGSHEMTEYVGERVCMNSRARQYTSARRQGRLGQNGWVSGESLVEKALTSVFCKQRAVIGDFWAPHKLDVETIKAHLALWWHMGWLGRGVAIVIVSYT